MNKQVTERDPYWDSLKFILIFIVVYGHMIETCVEISSFNQDTYNFIYIFHIPLFVFISGQFSRMKGNWIESLFHRTPIWITIVMMISLWLFVYFLINKDIQSVIIFGSYCDNSPIIPYYYLWARLFLYTFVIITSFFFMRIIYAKPLFSKYGSYTLAIFMYHFFIIQALRILLSKGIIPNNEVLSLVISIIICFSLAWLTQHYNVMTIMLNPFTYIITKYTKSL